MALKLWAKRLIAVAALCAVSGAGAFAVIPCTAYPFTTGCGPLTAAVLNSSFATVTAAAAAAASTASSALASATTANTAAAAAASTANAALASATTANTDLIPHVGTNTALKAKATTSYTTIIRDGFTTAGDGGAATYTSSNVACTLNAGAGDNGSQVQSADGKCWIADLKYPLDVRIWGKSTTDFYATPLGADVTGYCLETNATCSQQHALDRAQKFWVGSSGISVVHIAAGTATSGLVCAGAVPGAANGTTVPGNIWIVGAGPTNTIIADASAAPAAIIASDSCRLTLQDLKVTSANGSGLFPQYGAVIGTYTGFQIGATHSGQFHVEQDGTIAISAGYTISGGAPAHLECVLGGRITYSEATMTVTLTGTPAFSTAFADFADSGCGAYINSNFVSFSGAATGSRFKVARAASIRTEGGSGTYLPGNALGTLIDGGNYMPATGATLGVPTGLGTGGSPGVVTTSGSSDQSFSVQLTTGSTGGTPAVAGTVPLTFGSKLGLNGVACTTSVTDGGGAWGNGANVPLFGQTTAGATLLWNNLQNGALTNLATSQTYFINAHCRGY